MPATWRSPYLGLPGLRSFLPGDTGVAFSILNMMSLSKHTMGDDVAAVQFALPNYLGHLETGPGSATTVTAAVEFETGAFWKCTFNGSASGSIPNAGMIWTDPMPWVVPRGTRFGFRCYRTNVAGCPFTLDVQNPSIGERIEYNVTSDKTLGGTIATTDQTNWYGPCAARGLMTQPSVGIMGDSISLGQFDALDSTGAQGGIARVLQASGIPYTQLSVGGTTAQSFLAGYTNKIALGSLCSSVILCHGTNDANAGRTDAQIRADLTSIAALLPATQRKFLVTITPRTTGSWGDLVSQIAYVNQAVIDANNTWRLTVPAGFTGIFDVAAPLKSPGTSKWKFPGYTSDGVHPTTTGYAAIRDSGIISPYSFLV